MATKNKQLQFASASVLAISLCNALWLLGPWINPSISWVKQFASFYASSCEPNYGFFRIIDIGFCLATLIWTWLAWRQYPKPFVVTMILVGITTFGDAIYPAGCLTNKEVAPSFLQELRFMHSYTSAVGFLAGLVVVSYIAYWLASLPKWRTFALVLYVINMLFILEYNYAVIVPKSTIVGALQRIDIFFYSIWLLFIPMFANKKVVVEKSNNDKIAKQKVPSERVRTPKNHKS